MAITLERYRDLRPDCYRELCLRDRDLSFAGSSMAEVKKYNTEFAGKPLMVEVGRLGGQANGTVLVQYGETSVMVNATMSAAEKAVDYLPLQVEYEEKYYAAGKINSSKWIKREGRPSEGAILAGRLIDRPLRPRFNNKIRNEIQVVATVLSFDGVNDPDIVAMFGASLALGISDIPFDGPIAGVRMGRVDGKLIVNPTYVERATSDFDIVVAGTDSRINMIEAGAQIVPEAEIAAAIKAGFEASQGLIDFQKKIVAEIGKSKKQLTLVGHEAALAEEVRQQTEDKLRIALYVPGKGKDELYEGIGLVKNELMDYLKEKYAADLNLKEKLIEASVLFEEEIDRMVHKNILEEEKRPDGRKTDQLRSLSADVGILPHTHGTGLFNRGTTQALSILTLAAPGAEQWLESMEISLTKKRFMHHYSFPPYSTGEVKRLGALGRREIGHGYLAERSLEPIIPNKNEFPYTIRLVSEILSSNGSSSMASVCGSTLALMDGGVPIKAPAAGIAMGLMFDEKNEKYKILTDIQGPEDHHGDMDLKVAGTATGITGMQMDVKVDGITPQIVEETLAQALKARLEILNVITSAIATHRGDLSKHAPRVQTIMISPSKIGALIGPGGKNINGIIEQTGAQIDIEDDGSVFVTATTSESMEKTIKLIKGYTYEPQSGDEFDGTVVKILDFGAFVEIMPGMDGLVHVSEMSDEHVRHPSDKVKQGQQVHVWVKNIDDQGRLNLTMKPRNN